MEKKEAQNIARWLNGTILPLVEGLYDYPAQGDDGWQGAMKDGIADVRVAIMNFIQDNLLPVEKLPTKEREYGDLLRKLSSKQLQWQEETGIEMSESDWKYLYKARLFNRMLAMAKTDDKIGDITTAGDLFNHMEAEYLPKTEFYDKFYSKEYLHTGEIALRDVVEIILEQRKKAPQAKLFT